MPRKDPVTGCMVMTMDEFWQKMAEGSGKTAAQEEAEFWDEFRKDEENELARMKSPEGALSLIQQVAHSWRPNPAYPHDFDMDFTEDIPPYPIRVLEVLDAGYKQSLRHHGAQAQALCLCEGGGKAIFAVGYTYWSGTMLDPPDESSALEWHWVEPAGPIHSMAT